MNNIIDLDKTKFTLILCVLRFIFCGEDSFPIVPGLNVNFSKIRHISHLIPGSCLPEKMLNNSKKHFLVGLYYGVKRQFLRTKRV
jgi:hypothetical protein